MDDHKKKLAPNRFKKEKRCSLSSHNVAAFEETAVTPSETADFRKETDSKVSFRVYQDWSKITTEDLKNKFNEQQNHYLSSSLSLPSSEKHELPSAFMSRRKTYLPTKLHQMLSDVDTEEAISWLPNGRAWKIHSIKQFENTVLKEYFPQCKLPSFMKTINRWHFKRVKNGPDKKAYYHEVCKWFVPLMSSLLLVTCSFVKLLRSYTDLGKCSYYSCILTHMVLISNKVFQ